MLTLLLACASEYALDAKAPGAPGVEVSHVARPAPDEPVYTEVSVDGDDGSAVTAEEDVRRGIRRETFVLGGGETTPVTDFLFVLDSSASMKRVVDRVRAAFTALGDGGAFPAEARVAVMGMTPGDPADLARAHPAVAHRGRNRRDPGFLKLVNAGTIAAFRKIAPDVERARFADDGCASPWFRPGERNAAGVPCLVAHTQIAMDATRAEAGMTAFAQLLEKMGDAPLFRPGAAVNVVFVSDTQDPGLGPDAPELDALVALRPDVARLAELVDVANTVASFRVHAIAPASECAESWRHLGPVYQDAAAASGGRTLDVCTAEDYGDFVRAIAKDGAVPDRAVVALGRTALDATVTVDGRRVGFTASPDGRALMLDHTLGDVPARVTVEYAVKRR